MCGQKLSSRAEELSKTSGNGYIFTLALATDCCLYCIFGHIHQFQPTVCPQCSFYFDSVSTEMPLCDSGLLFRNDEMENSKP